MDGYTILALAIFCITTIALVAMFLGNKDVANKAITALSDTLKILTRRS